MNNLKILNNQLQTTQIASLQKDINWLKENKKQEIKNKYNAIYRFYKIDSFLGLGVSGLMLLYGLTETKKTPISKLSAIVGSLGLLGYPLYRPKKEKYDEAMQKELNEVV